MRKLLQILVVIAMFLGASGRAENLQDRVSVIFAVGAGGEEKYADTFSKWAANWRRAGEVAGAKTTSIGDDQAAESPVQRLKAAIEAEPREGLQELWLVLLGHGTSDGKDPKFNFRGDDVAASEVAAWLQPFQRPVVVVCAFSASGAWLKPLAAPGRVVVTATKSGAENNYSRFGGYLSQAIADPAADMDKDGETSLLEAWLVASRKTAEFYKEEGRLATEHSLLDDSGDGLGTSADWFQGVRAVKKAKDGAPDGLRARQMHLIHSAEERALTAEQRAVRDTLERELTALRERKSGMKEDEYLRELEAILLKLARIYRGSS